jgi:hypothetical protein
MSLRRKLVVGLGVLVVSLSTAVPASADTGPTLVGVTHPFPPYVFDEPGSPTLFLSTYSVHATDSQSAIASVRVDLVGPGGAHLSATGYGNGSQDTTTNVHVDFDATDAVGTWTVDEIDLTDAAGNTTTLTGLSLLPIIHTDDSVLKMTGFTLNPNPVNDWSSAQTVDLSVPVTGPAPVTSVSMYIDKGCTAGTPSLPGTANGTVTIPITVAEGTASCRIWQIGMTDSAGDGAVYGADIPISPTPADITGLKGAGPVVTNVTVDKSSVDWAIGGTVTVTMDVSSWGPGVTGLVASAQGSIPQHYVSGPQVNESRLENGTVSATIPVPPHQDLDRYAVNVKVWDAAGDTTNYSAASLGFSVAGSNGVSAYVPEPWPVRVLDTRSSGSLGGNQTRTVNPGVPADATAVVLNVTAVNPTAGSYLTVWQDGGARPGVSNLNFTPGQTVPNLVTVPLGSNGLVDVYNHTGSVDLVVDVFGYYLADGGGYFVPLTPSRVVDTRDGTGTNSATPLTSGRPVAASLNLPNPSYISAVVLNVTATDATSAGYLSVQATTAVPTTSNLNFVAGQTVANLVVLPGNTPVFYTNAASVDVVADLVGYYVTFSSVAPHSSVFVPATPSRILDTRDGVGAPQAPLGPGGQVDVQVAGAAGVPANASAAVLNVTAVDGTADSYLTTWPDNETRPGTSTLDFTPGQVVSNLDAVAIGPDRLVDVWNHAGSVNAVADLFGYFLPPSS